MPVATQSPTTTSALTVKRQLDHAWLESVGLGSLTGTTAAQLLAFVYERLEMAVGMRIAELCTSEQLDEFEGFIDRDDEAGALEWLQSVCPEHGAICRAEFDEMTERVREQSADLLARLGGAEVRALLMLTRAFEPAGGSAIDPLVEEVTWQAWEMVAADPSRVSEAAVQVANIRFDTLVEAAWRPGRAALISELEWTPHPGGSGQLAVRLAAGTFGPRGTTAFDAAGVTPRATSAVTGGGVFSACEIDPALIVPGQDLLAPAPGHAAHLVQGTWGVGDDADLVEIVSRFSATVEPWGGLVDQLAQMGQEIRVRATVLATELSPADRLEIEGGLRRIRAIRDRCDGRPEIEFDTNRGEATLLDLRASLSSPVLAGEIAVVSPDPVPDTLLRSLAASFTSESDVLRQQGRIVVASNRLVLGGFEVRRDPQGWPDAQRLGVPLRGGLLRRELRDLITLTESPIGWPIPAGRPIPTIDTRIPIERPVPTGLALGADDEEQTVIGRSPGGVVVALPVALRTRHLVSSGTWGAGKSTLQFHLALDDLRNDRSLLVLDPHGTNADLLIAHARLLGRDPLVIDAADGGTDQVSVLPRLGRSARQRAVVDASIQRLTDAVASCQHNPEWTGPRWHATFNALLELVVVHGGELLDAAVWMNDPDELGRRLRHPGVSPLARSTLANLTAGSDHASDIRGWVSAKLHPLVSGAVRRVVAPVGKGIDIGAAVASGRPVIVSLAALSTSEGAMLSHLIATSVIDAAFSRPLGERDLVTVYWDEIHRSPGVGLSRILAEGRKFGVALVAATQGLGQLDGDLADLAMAAGTQVVFRATLDTAARMSSIVDVSARELMGQPDLHAVVMVAGQPATSVVLPPFEQCAVPRVVEPPIERRARRPKAKPKPKLTVVSPKPVPTPPHGPSTLVDDFLAFRQSTDAKAPVDDATAGAS